MQLLLREAEKKLEPAEHPRGAAEHLSAVAFAALKTPVAEIVGARCAECAVAVEASVECATVLEASVALEAVAAVSATLVAAVV